MATTRTRPQANHLSRPILIDLFMSGHLAYRWKGSGGNPGSLPVFSVDTAEQAQAMQARFCLKQYDGGYVWTDFDGEYESIGKVTKALQAMWEHMEAVKR